MRDGKPFTQIMFIVDGDFAVMHRQEESDYVLVRQPRNPLPAATADLAAVAKSIGANAAYAAMVDPNYQHPRTGDFE